MRSCARCRWVNGLGFWATIGHILVSCIKEEDDGELRKMQVGCRGGRAEVLGCAGWEEGPQPPPLDSPMISRTLLNCTKVRLNLLLQATTCCFLSSTSVRRSCCASPAPSLASHTLVSNHRISVPTPQVMLCIPDADRDKMHGELCGQIFKDAVNEALGAGERLDITFRFA